MCLKRLIVSVLLVYPVCLSGCAQPQVPVSDLAQAHQVPAESICNPSLVNKHELLDNKITGINLWTDCILPER